MNVLLWVLQVALALLYLAGGIYKVSRFDELARQFSALSRGRWRALGALEVLGAVLLVAPAAANWLPVLTPLAAQGWAHCTGGPPGSAAPRSRTGGRRRVDALLRECAQLLDLLGEGAVDLVADAPSGSRWRPLLRWPARCAHEHD